MYFCDYDTFIFLFRPLAIIRLEEFLLQQKKQALLEVADSSVPLHITEYRETILRHKGELSL